MLAASKLSWLAEQVLLAANHIGDEMMPLLYVSSM
jgi:hypothetical protein